VIHPSVSAVAYCLFLLEYSILAFHSVKLSGVDGTVIQRGIEITREARGTTRKGGTDASFPKAPVWLGSTHKQFWTAFSTLSSVVSMILFTRHKARYHGFAGIIRMTNSYQGLKMTKAYDANQRRLGGGSQLCRDQTRFCWEHRSTGLFSVRSRTLSIYQPFIPRFITLTSSARILLRLDGILSRYIGLTHAIDCCRQDQFTFGCTGRLVRSAHQSSGSRIQRHRKTLEPQPSVLGCRLSRRRRTSRG